MLHFTDFRFSGLGTAFATEFGMWRKFKRLFIIKTKFEAFLIVYALATGAVARGQDYLIQYPGFGGKLLFLACTGAVFMAGAKMLEAIEYHKNYGQDY